MSKPLLFEDEDYLDLWDYVDDYRLHEVHMVIAIRYKEIENQTEREVLLEIDKWILDNNPSFDDFLSDEVRSLIIYNHACQLRSINSFKIHDLLINLDNHFLNSDLTNVLDC